MADLRTLLLNQDEIAYLTMTRFLPLEMKRRGAERKLVIKGKTSPAAPPDPALLKAVARGHRWFGELAAGTVPSIRVVARREGLGESYVKHLIPLASDILRSMARGTQPPP